MSSKIDLITFLQFVLILGIILILYGVFSPSKNVIVNDKQIKKTNIWKSFDAKTIVAIVLASIVLAYAVTFFSKGIVTKSILFITIVSLAPYFLINNQKRIHQESTFKDIMVFCSSTVSLLKQNYTVPDAIKEASKDVGAELANDMDVLRESFRSDKYGIKVKEVMKIIHDKYPYTCIDNLNIILLIRHFDASKETMPDSLYDTYQDDLSKLEQDVNANKEKRTKMRVTYIGLSIGGMAMYYYFYKTMIDSIQDVYNTPLFNIINLIYAFLLVISVFFVDRYFNSTQTKE